MSSDTYKGESPGKKLARLPFWPLVLGDANMLRATATGVRVMNAPKPTRRRRSAA